MVKHELPPSEEIIQSQITWLRKLQAVDSKNPIETVHQIGERWHVCHHSNLSIEARTILQREIVIDMDTPDWKDIKREGDKLKIYLEREKIPHLMAWSGGKGVHIHVFIDGKSITLPDHLEADKEKYCLDLPSIARGALAEHILLEAGVDKHKAFVDFGKITWKKKGPAGGGRGSLIREFGHVRRDGEKFAGGYKTLINEIPDKRPTPGNIALTFPKSVELWNVGERGAEIVQRAISNKLQQASLTDLSKKAFDGQLDNIHCYHRISQGMPSGLRNKGAFTLGLFCKQRGLAEDQADRIANTYAKLCPDTDLDLERECSDSVKSAYRGNHYPSCTMIRDTFGEDICKRQNCPYIESMERPPDKDPELTADIIARAKEIILDGKALDYILETYRTIHYGDIEINRVFSIALACQSIINTQGVQPTTTGERGVGKTSGVRACCHLLPRQYLIEASFSNKALFYMPLEPGTVIFSDDTALTPELNDMVKRAMSNFQSTTDHVTLDGNRKDMKLSIPPRTVFLFTSVDTQGDEQLADRQYPISISNAPGDNDGYVRWLLKRTREGEEDYPMNERVLVCRAIYGEIKKRTFRVIIPFSEYITFTDPKKRREVRYFLDFIKAVAVYHYPERSPSQPDETGVTTITATVDDMLEAANYFESNKDIRKFSLTKEEMALWGCIWENKNTDNEISFPDLFQKWSKKTNDDYNTFIRKLRGRKDRGTMGLISKVPQMFVEELNRMEADLNIQGDREVIIPKQSRRVNVVRCFSKPDLYIYENFYIFDEKGFAADSKIAGRGSEN